MKSKSNTLIQRLLANWHAKVIALVASLFIFIFYRISTQSEIQIALEVKLPAGYEIAREWPQTIRIIVRGNKSPEQLNKENFKASVDLSSFVQGGNVRGTVKVDRMGDAQKLGALEFDFSPTLIPFVLEPVVDKYVPVDIKATLSGMLPKCYSLQTFTVAPQTVLIRGPKSQVEGVSMVTTEKLDLTGKTSSFSARLKVFTNNKFVRPIDALEVGSSVILNEKREKRSIADIDIRLSGLTPELLAKNVPKGKIEIEASECFLDSLKKDQLQLVADCRDVTVPGEYQLALSPRILIELPPEAVISSYEPTGVKIQFARK